MFCNCRKLLKQVLLFVEREYAEVAEELALCYTDLLLQPCQASIVSPINHSLSFHLPLLVILQTTMAYDGHGIELHWHPAGCQVDVQDILLWNTTQCS